MDSYRRQQIQAQAWTLLQDTGVSALPVRPLEIAQRLQIHVEAKPAAIAGASGWLIRNGDEYAIVYATHIDSVGFQNFSIAHELGHYSLAGHPEHIFLSGNQHSSRAGFSSTDAFEQEAHYFAACLLMPKPLCLPLIIRNVDGMSAVRALAESCQTSLVASALRYAEIGAVPAGVIQCHRGRVEFCATYPLISRVGWAKALVRNAKMPEHSATWRLAEDHAAVVAGWEDSDTAPASDWFSGASGRYELVEEVIGLGTFGRTLTLLTLTEADEDDDDDDDEGSPLRFR